MKESEVREIQERAICGDATISDVVRIVGDTLVSSSKHSKEIKELLENLTMRLERVERQTLSPIWQMMVEDESADESDDAAHAAS